jgi:hypothetical protein
MAQDLKVMTCRSALNVTPHVSLIATYNSLHFESNLTGHNFFILSTPWCGKYKKVMTWFFLNHRVAALQLWSRAS